MFNKLNTVHQKKDLTDSRKFGCLFVYLFVFTSPPLFYQKLFFAAVNIFQTFSIFFQHASQTVYVYLFSVFFI